MKHFLLLLALFANVVLCAQTITITSPNGGEVWQGCTTQTITWNDSGTSNFYSIDYSINGGVNWTSIATFYNTTDGEYVWTVPNIQSTNVLIRVQDSNNNAIEDVSNLNFSLAAPLLLTYPNGNETIQGGDNVNITWVAANTSNYYILEYSLDGGNTWSYIDDFFYNTNGSFNWNVPNTPSANVLVQITDYYEACKSDKSDNLLEIIPATPTITITSPYAGQTYYATKQYNITWTSEYVVSDQVQIEFSNDNGANWQIIASITEDDGLYTWTAPNVISDDYLIRITDLANPSTFDVSDNFSVAAPFIDVTYPNGGEIETQCEQFTITWNSGGSFNNRFRILYSEDNGASWTTIASNQLGSSYNWVYPPIEGPALIRVEDNNNAALFDDSDAPFTLAPHGDIIITSPNGGENIQVGTNHTITWASVSPVNYVELYYSIDNGVSWLLIDDFENSDGNFNWNVPNTPSTECLIRIEDYYNGNCRYDVSDVVFTIVPPTPIIEITNIGAFENQVYYPNKGYNLNWNSEYLTSPFVSIDFSDDNGASWTNIIAATEDDGSYVVTFAEEYSETCLFRVSEVGSMVEGISPFNFAVRPPFIEITYPTGGEVETQCEAFNITWTSGGTFNNRFRIQYSVDNGASWTTIASNQTGTSYNWVYPPVSGPVMVRVEDNTWSYIFDESDTPFTLSPNTDIIITSPNGGETLEVGTNVTINWASVSPVNYVELYYSIDNGVSWLLIDDFENSDGNFNWNVPNNPSTQCLIRIEDYYNGNCRFDVSDAIFTIAPPTPVIEITNIGAFENQVYYPNKGYNLNWTSEYTTSPFVAIDFSDDNGATWTNIIAATEDDGSYVVTFAEEYSETCLFRVSEVGSMVEGISPFNFAVRPPFIEITYPTGGEVETQCEAFNITWTSGGTFNNRFRIQYSVDNGASWTTIASNQTGTSYNWVYPPVSGPVMMRVEDNTWSYIFDESDTPFTLSPNTDIIITSPNGGETLEVGTNVTINWASVSPVNYVELYYSIDNGASWLLIDDFENSDGNFNWNVPNNPSTQCLIRIEDYYNGNCRFDVSDAIFTIAPPTPVIEITNIGAFENQVYYPNKGYNLNWTSEYTTSPFVAIDFSDDNGATWTNIIAATEDDGSYVVTFAEEYSETCLFRVSEVGSMVEGVSPFNFAVRPPFIEITYPTGGEVETQCEAFNITWTSGGTFNNRFRIQYSVDNGASWTTIASNQTGTSYNWVYPPVSGPVMMRVEDNTWSYIFDESDSPFTLSPNTDIIITSPNGGETLEVGTNVTINWASVSPVNYVELYYSIDNGVSWLLIDDFENSDGNFNWNVPNNPSTQCLIRIEDYYNGNCRFDVSDAIFTIAPPTPVIEITNIGAFENQVYYPNKGYNLNWNSEYLTSPFVSIDFSDDNGASWTNIIAATEDDGSYVVTFAEDYSETCLFRVSEVGSMVEGISPFNFAVRPPFIEITYPTGGEVETQCEAFNITWTSGGTFNNRFRIQYSVDNGASWTTIASNQTGTSYNWVYPPVSGPVMVRVEDNTWSYIFDESDTPFTLSPNNDIIVTSPNGGETLISGTTHQITWASISPVNYVQIYLSLDNGVTWDYIDDFENSDGLYNWNVPNTPSNECLVRIVDYYNAACRVDESDATFSIEQPEPQVTYPNTSQVFGQYQTVNITWTDEYYNSSFVLIELSEDNGASWQTISAAEVNDGSYSWLVPEVISTECLIRITSIDNPSETDVSDETFEIREAIIVTSPNGDNGIQDWRVCTETTVTWTSVGTSAYFRIYYSTDNGNSWTSLNSNYYSPGVTHSFDWILPSAPSPATLVRVENRYNTLQVDESDDTFTIAPAITITGPNGGEVLGVGQNIDITWLNEGASEFYDIDYSVDGGVSWNNIAFNVYIPNESYSWVVPGQLSTNYLIRVTDNIDNCKSDISDDLFEVSGVQQGLVNLNYPLGGESFAACTQVVIDWNAVNTSDEFTIDYSLDNGASWSNIVSNFYTLDQQYVWTVPNNASAEALIRVYDSTSPVFTDQSNFAFNISAPVASAGNDVTICVGETTVLQASGGVSYAWSPSAGLSDAGSSSPNASPTTTTTYTVTITDVNGCAADDLVVVTVESDCDITGCTDENAWNYNPNATFDDGFCLYTEGGNVTCAEDINGDGIVSTGDLLSLLGAYGQLCD